LGEGCLLLRGREGKEGDGKRKREDGKGSGGRARHVCIPINKKNYHYTAAP